jgi:predicted metal-dependent phosphoesterase TrpH
LVKENYKGIIHFHSRYSYDSNNSLKNIIERSVTLGLDFLILTDHDSIKGNLMLLEKLKGQGIEIEVPICAEFSTEYGDIIGAFLSGDIRYNNYDDLIKQIRDQEGLVILPHPYYKHSNISSLIKDADLIEIFNPYLSEELNSKAVHAAETSGKKGYYGSDSHTKRSFGNVISITEDLGDLKKSLLEGEIRHEILSYPGPYEKSVTQIIKAFKKKNLKLLILSVLKIVKIFFVNLIRRT